MARKILLADDSVTAQNMGRKILTDAGYEVVTVNNGSAALKKISENKPDLIVLDVYMPGYSGLEVCQRIKEKADTARIPVLLTVGKLEPFKPEEARRARADAFVVKPFEASELLAALTKLEDKVIPQPEPYKPGRFAKAVASFERDTEADKPKDADDGWKARLRIPSSPKPKDTQPDPDYGATQGKGVRDFVEAPAKKNDASPAAKESEFERPLPAGVPHDITPEEIAAITAAAAQLSGAPFAAVETSQNEQPSPEPEAQVESSESPVEEPAPVTFASAPEIAEVAVLATETMGEAPAPETPTEVASVADEISPVEPASTEAIAPEEPRAESPVSVTPEVPVEPAEVVVVPESAREEATSTAEAVAAPAEPIAPWPGGPADVPVSAETTPAAGDDEVMAALQTLMPQTTSTVEPTNGQPKPAAPASGFAAALAAADAVVDRVNAVGPRWIAEEVALASDEAALSLEQEMEKVSPGIHPAAEPTTVASVMTEAASPESVTGSAFAGQTAYAMASAAGVGETISPTSSVGSLSPGHDSAGETAAIEPVETSVADSAATMESSGLQSPEESSAPIEGVSVTSAPDEITHVNAENEMVGGIEDMAANWKNIRDSFAGAAAKPAPIKEEFQETESAKPEPAITAAPEQPSAASPVTDPKAIARIVDSVLAELRPKIVEEIARKLADPKKD